MNLVFIGYRASGKTTIGKELSLRLGRAFVDTDEVIEQRVRGSIREIVRSHGWDYFRRMEKEVILEFARKDRLILSTGGGAVLDRENVKALRSNGLIFWLKGEPEILLKRMANDPRTVTTRPPLTEKGFLQEFRELLAEREPFYRAASDMEIDTSHLHVDQVVLQVLSMVKERQVMTTLGRKLVRDPF